MGCWGGDIAIICNQSNLQISLGYPQKTKIPPLNEKWGLNNQT